MTHTEARCDDENQFISTKTTQQQEQYKEEEEEELLHPGAGSGIPEVNGGFLRFYKGLACRDRRQPGSVAAAAATAAAVATDGRRSRKRRWPGRRLRSVGAQRARNNCLEGDEPVDGEEADEATDESSHQHPAAAVLKHLIKSSTMDSRSKSSSADIVCSDNIDNAQPRVRYIFNKGRMQPVEIMKWPGMRRIPMAERYRLEEPMKQVYGKHSMVARLFRSLRKGVTGIKPGDICTPIPLLPRHLTEQTKSRLKLWYKTLESSGEFSGQEMA